MLGFDTLKDLLEVILVPAIGGTIALLWPQLLANDRRRRFERLIGRELEEVAPHPKEAWSDETTAWYDHQKKDFLHKRILEDASSNREFILTLDPTLVYQVSQLWSVLKDKDHVQWLYYLKCLSKHYGGRVTEAHEDWHALIASYETSSTGPPPAPTELNPPLSTPI